MRKRWCHIRSSAAVYALACTVRLCLCTLARSVVVLGVVFTLASCLNKTQRALQALERNNMIFSVEDFVASAGRGDLETIELFLAAGMDPNALDVNGYTATMLAAEQGNTDAVKLLLENKASPNVQGIEGSTALMQAAFHNRPDVVDSLLNAGADPTLKDEKGWTAFMKAVYQGHERIVERMLPISSDQLGRALMVASIMGHEGVVRRLLAAGVEVDQKERGQTALMMAASRGNENIVQLLLNHGAQPLEANDEGRTASMIAMVKGHKRTARMLQEAEAGRLPEPLPAKEPAQTEPAEVASSPIPPAPTATEPSGTSQPVVAARSPGDETATRSKSVTSEGTSVPDSPDASPSVAPTEPIPDTPAPAEVPPLDAAGPLVAGDPSTQPPTGLTQADSTPLPNRPSSPEPAPAVLPSADQLASDLSDTSPPSRSAKLRLLEFHENQYPVILTGIEAGIGEFRVLSDGGGDLVYAREGDRIPGTPFRVTSLRSKRIVDKEGTLVDASEARVRDEEKGSEIRLVKGLPARAAQSFAMLAVSGESEPIKVRENEEFALPGDASTLYRVLDLRESQAVIQVVETGETLTVMK